MEVVVYLMRAVFLSSERSNTFILFSFDFNDFNINLPALIYEILSFILFYWIYLDFLNQKYSFWFFINF